MRTLKTVSIVGSAIALLLTSGVAFAHATSPATSTTRMEGEQEKVAHRLGDIKDKSKQDMAARLTTQFETLNKTWTDRFSQLLDRYEAILLKIKARADAAAVKGKDVSATTAAIQSAKTAIASARAAVAAQAAKSYVPVATSIPSTATSTSAGQLKIMQSLRKSFQDLHKSLFRDLFALRDGSMKDARKAVHNALETLKQTTGEGTATSTEKSDQ